MERGTAATRVAMCTFIGALAGGWIATAFTSGILPAWLGVTVGMAVGAAIGAVLYAWHEIKQAVPEAFRRATSWRPDFAAVKRGILEVAGFLNLFLSGAAVGALIMLLGEIFIGRPTVGASFVGFYVVVCFFGGLAGASIASDVVGDCNRYRVVPCFEDRRWWLKYNPVTVCTFWPIVFIGRAVLFVCRALLTAPGFVCRFTRELFLLVYSDGLYVTGFWAAAGAVLGYTTGALVLSALAAAACGWVSYRLITVRRMVPARNANGA